MFTIEKNIPVTAPTGARGPRSKYPWPQLEVGDSFAMPTNGNAKSDRRRLLAAALSYAKKTGTRFVAGYESQGETNFVRVWRVE